MITTRIADGVNAGSAFVGISSEAPIYYFVVAPIKGIDNDFALDDLVFFKMRSDCMIASSVCDAESDVICGLMLSVRNIFQLIMNDGLP